MQVANEDLNIKKKLSKTFQKFFNKFKQKANSMSLK